MSTRDLLQSPVIAGLISGLLVAIVTQLLTRKKTAAEIEKLHAEAELTRAQAHQLTESLRDNLNNLSDKVGYRLPEPTAANEALLYSSDASDAFDFRVVRVEDAEGDLDVKDGILYIRRRNTAGTLQVWLENYTLPGQPSQRALPKNEDLAGDRKLRLSCDVKAVGGQHTLLFLVKGENDPAGVHLAEKRERVAGNDWTSVEAYFRVSPAKNCQVRIDDRSVSTPSSSVQIRNLVLAERVTAASGSGVRAL
ncbi:MAG TPA: hypothetical protein VKB38_14125 [Terracidiphilus sp.]|nr:hypothetical protein [Terracidiphilus sp.]